VSTYFAPHTHQRSVILSGAQRAQSKDPDALHPATTAGTFLPLNARVPRPFRVGSHSLLKERKGALAPRLTAYLTLTALILFLFATQALAQGCAQCLDSTRATPPAVQAAYRHAILLLGGCGATFFLAGALLLRYNRR
jgi:hypothetical protein